MSERFFKKNTLVFAIITLSYVAPLAVWMQSVGGFEILTYRQYPNGQMVYLFSKLCGLLSYSTAWLQIILGFLIRANIPALDKTILRCHIIVACSLIFFLLAHVLGFIGAVYLRSGNAPFHLLLPYSTSDFYHISIAYGAAALGLVGLVIGSGILRRRFLNSVYSKGHLLWSIAAILVIQHASSIGTEFNQSAFFALNLIYLGVLIGVLWFRYMHLLGTRAVGFFNNLNL